MNWECNRLYLIYRVGYIYFFKWERNIISQCKKNQSLLTALELVIRHPLQRYSTSQNPQAQPLTEFTGEVRGFLWFSPSSPQSPHAQPLSESRGSAPQRVAAGAGSDGAGPRACCRSGAPSTPPPLLSGGSPSSPLLPWLCIPLLGCGSGAISLPPPSSRAHSAETRRRGGQAGALASLQPPPPPLC